MGDNTVKIALKLLLITLVAGLALGLTNAVTKDPIQEQELAAAEAARREVLTADSFYEVPLDTLKADSSIQWAAGNDTVTAVYGAKAADGSFAGTVVEITGKGYGLSLIHIYQPARTAKRLSPDDRYPASHCAWGISVPGGRCIRHHRSTERRGESPGCAFKDDAVGSQFPSVG